MTVKNVFVIESFIQEICSKMLIHPVMKQVKYLSESLNHSIKPIFHHFNIKNWFSLTILF